MTKQMAKPLKGESVCFGSQWKGTAHHGGEARGIWSQGVKVKQKTLDAQLTFLSFFFFPFKNSQLLDLVRGGFVRAISHTWRSGTACRITSLPQHMGPRDCTQSVGLGGKHLYPPSHLSSPLRPSHTVWDPILGNDAAYSGQVFPTQLS